MPGATSDRLAALVPRPRVNLTRSHGVLTPNHRWRAEVMPSGSGRRKGRGNAQPGRSAIERHAAMRWAQRLKRVCGIDVEGCVRFGESVKVIACIEEPALIARIPETEPVPPAHRAQALSSSGLRTPRPPRFSTCV